MQAGTEAGTTVKGRKDQGQEAVVKPDILVKKLPELVNLFNKKVQAAEACNDAIKTTAEKAGLLASVVAKVVAAQANDKFEEEKKKAGQLALAFDECTE